jgi:glucose/arabinose dehydrogenase
MFPGSSGIAALATAIFVVSACGNGTGASQQPAAPPTTVETPGQLKHHEIKASELPPPNTGPDATNAPDVISKPADAKLVLPDGFEIATYAEGGFQRPRWVAVAPNGDVFVADSEAGKILILRDANKDGVPDERFTFASGLKQPFGMAFHGDSFFVGNTNAVVRFDYKPGQTAAAGEPAEIAQLPGKGYREHWTRNVVVSPDGSKLYATVGSESNVSPEDDARRAAILQMNLDGSDQKIFASGLRNPIGLDFNPTSKALFAAVQERDRLGDDLVPDYVTEVKEGGFYGWPYSYAGQIVDPRRKGEKPELVAKAIVPDVLLQAHSAVLGFVFYNGTMFPEEYRGDAFAAFHGSWNRSKRTGYKIVRVPFSGARPSGGYDDFLTGWMLGPDRKEVWGRPVGLAVLPDGSLLVVDDGANKIWRVTYKSPSKPSAPPAASPTEKPGV